MDESWDKVVPVSCDRDCGGGCPLLAYVRDGRVVKVTDNPAVGADFRGCIKGYRLPDTTYASDRLNTPLRRLGARGEGRFEEISWSEALDHISERLGLIKQDFGPMSILAFNSSGSCRAMVHNTCLVGARFFGLLGGYVNYTDSYSSSAAKYVQEKLFGTRLIGLDPDTLEDSRLIILWGANICSARLGGRLEGAVTRAKAGGTKIVVIDPRRSRTVNKLADEWIPIRPGTDSAMMAAVLYTLKSEGFIDHSFVGRYSVGFDELLGYLSGQTDGLPKTPGWAASICGVAEDTIIRLARLLGRTKPAALIPGLSIQRTLGGEEAYRFAAAIQLALGNLGRSGGSSGAGIPPLLPSPKAQALPIPDTSQLPVIPIYRWPDLVLEGKAGGYPADIRAIYNIGSNLLNQGSDIAKNIRAYKKMDLVVTHDIFMTPTARYSDIVLPVTTSLEREDAMIGTDNCLLYSSQAIEPLQDTRNDFDIFCELAHRMGFGEDYSQGRTADQWLAHLLPQSAIEDIESFKKKGIFLGPDRTRVGLSDFIRDPKSNPLATSSGKIEINSQAFTRAGISATPVVRVTEPPDQYPLRLVTPHSRYRINSQNSNLPWARKIIKDVLVMNTEDGRTRGIESGDLVSVTSPQGAMTIKVELTDEIMSGCLCLTQGAWSKLDNEGTEIGAATNSLTSNQPTLPSGGSRTHSVFVEANTISLKDS